VEVGDRLLPVLAGERDFLVIALLLSPLTLSGEGDPLGLDFLRATGETFGDNLDGDVDEPLLADASLLEYLFGKPSLLTLRFGDVSLFEPLLGVASLAAFLLGDGSLVEFLVGFVLLDMVVSCLKSNCNGNSVIVMLC
jgi:hypothetical protein